MKSINASRPTERVPRAALVRPILEWFWRSAVIAETSRTFPPPSRRSAELAERAHAVAGVAFSTPPSDEPDGYRTEAITCELFRQACYWALLARSPRVEAHDGYELSVWDALDEPSLRDAGVPTERRTQLSHTLRKGSFIFFAELPVTERLATHADLRRVAQVQLRKLARRERALTSLYRQRAVRVSLPFMVSLLFWWMYEPVKSLVEGRRDIALGKSWVTSSRFSVPGCKSPAQRCPESPDFFFHTNNEESPWFEIDLGAPMEFSGLRVENRAELPERAAPLIIEVSDDHQSWQVVARRQETFSTWRANFSPVRSRWVRLRVQKQTCFHLARVRILP